ncbi:hypothetical protein Tco_1031705 [Tanacetum coccineum]|uniref:Uncharacterized protein n=1 Tax=Tanacetum coccineum TaxID=301880 RepID=A0ABQ5GAK2_9ASTR
MEAEVEQYDVDKKSVEIEGKNLLIENENLLADCLSNELLYSVINIVNTVSRFSERHDAYTVEQARKVELKDEISKLKHKIQKDHSEMIKHFSNLEEVDINKKTENQAKMTKLSMEWKRLCKIKAKVQKWPKSEVITEDISCQTEPELRILFGAILKPSDGPEGKAHSIFMKTGKTKWASIITTAHLCCN